uniref:Uncharacterized protein n=1 Tax=Pipistrellus kuhlii TaxID=59472 RepID=A0A7J7X062_PIPKU|nr:hypothetical protein mPipKuh1_010785 [Pipistrellus kuhlii]
MAGPTGSPRCHLSCPADGLRPLSAVGLGRGRPPSGSLTTGLVLNLGGSEFFSTSQRCRTLKGVRMKAPGAHGRKGGTNTSWICEKMNVPQPAQASGKLVLCGPFPRAPGLPAAPATSRPTWKLSDVRRRGTRQTRLPMP